MLLGLKGKNWSEYFCLSDENRLFVHKPASKLGRRAERQKCSSVLNTKSYWCFTQKHLYIKYPSQKVLLGAWGGSMWKNQGWKKRCLTGLRWHSYTKANWVLTVTSDLAQLNQSQIAIPSIFAMPEAGIPRLTVTCSLHSNRVFHSARDCWISENSIPLLQLGQFRAVPCLAKFWSSESLQSLKVHNVHSSLLQSEERFFLKISATYLGFSAWVLLPVTSLTSMQKSGTIFSSSALRGEHWDVPAGISPGPSLQLCCAILVSSTSPHRSHASACCPWVSDLH